MPPTLTAGRARALENRSFLLLVALATLAFLWTLQGFLLPVFWAVAFAILFTPLFRRLDRLFSGHSALASLATLLVILLLIVLPLVGIGVAVTSEAVSLYTRVASGEINVAEPVAQIEAMLPRLSRRAAEAGIDLDRVRTGLETAALAASRELAARLLALGQYTLTFTLLLVVTFYTLFYFLKDGERLMDRLVAVLPLGDARERRLFSKFAAVTRATVKGTFVVAAVQGTIGGVTFALLGLGSPLLWGVTMGLMSLLPAIGAAAVWIPAAVFLLASGEPGRALILVGVGAGIIGVVDNMLRPVLVGRDAGMPDYMILLSTLGGLAAFGISGLVVGPIVAGLFLTVWEIFGEEFGGLDTPSVSPTVVVATVGETAAGAPGATTTVGVPAEAPPQAVPGV